jgi:hypothetical protein
MMVLRHRVHSHPHRACRCFVGQVIKAAVKFTKAGAHQRARERAAREARRAQITEDVMRQVCGASGKTQSFVPYGPSVQTASTTGHPLRSVRLTYRRAAQVEQGNELTAVLTATSQTREEVRACFSLRRPVWQCVSTTPGTVD